MSTETVAPSVKEIQFNSDEFNEFVSTINNRVDDHEHHIILIAGRSEKKKNQAFNAIQNSAERTVIEVDANDLLTVNETKTREHIDHLFATYNAENDSSEMDDISFKGPAVPPPELLDLQKKMENSKPPIVYLKNGSNLCGAFTGFSLSKIKYATPQEKYFLKQLKAHHAFVIIDFNTMDGIDQTLRRESDTIITVNPPQKGLQRLLAKLKQIHVNGFDLDSDRPINNELKTGNF